MRGVCVCAGVRVCVHGCAHTHMLVCAQLKAVENVAGKKSLGGMCACAMYNVPVCVRGGTNAVFGSASNDARTRFRQLIRGCKQRWPIKKRHTLRAAIDFEVL